MAFTYIEVEEARQHDGLVMVVVGGVPSPWGEAAKGIFHLLGIDWKAVRLRYESDEIKKWLGKRSGPIAVYNQGPAKDGWSEILLLAESLSKERSLLPKDAMKRALVMGLSHEIIGEMGLCWSRRIQLVHHSLSEQGGFVKPIAQYLGKKYGYSERAGAEATGRVNDLLEMLSQQLHSQKEKGSSFFVGDCLTVVDVYAAVAMALWKPLPEEYCKMDKGNRVAFETGIEGSCEVEPILFDHRDRMYEHYLELPLAL